MSLKVIEERSGLTGERTATVTIESPLADEVTGPDAQRLAIKTASSMGLGVCGISQQSGAYQPLPDGKIPETLEDYHKISQILTYHGPNRIPYRNDFTCMQSAGG